MSQLGKAVPFGYLSVFLLIMAVLSSTDGSRYEESSPEINIRPDTEEAELSQPAAKRAAVFLDKLIMAVRRGSLHNKSPLLEAQKLHQPNPSTLNDDPSESKHSSAGSSNLQRNLLEVNTHEPNAKHFIAYPRMGLVRRGQKSGRVFWRCYFNAVSCFKK